MSLTVTLAVFSLFPGRLLLHEPDLLLSLLLLQLGLPPPLRLLLLLHSMRHETTIGARGKLRGENYTQIVPLFVVIHNQAERSRIGFPIAPF